MTTPSLKLQLAHHPNNPPALNNTVAVELSINSNSLRLIYTLDDSASKLLIPPPAPPVQSDNLWQHTCFEAFIGIVNQPHYLEFNFSPSGEWAAYAFSAYRERSDWQTISPPAIRTVQTDTGLQLAATLLLDSLPCTFCNQPLELGISTVLEGKEQSLAYLALAHATEIADFHQREQWIRLRYGQ